jgi:hypothetical protein
VEGEGGGDEGGGGEGEGGGGEGGGGGCGWGASGGGAKGVFTFISEVRPAFVTGVHVPDLR